jgi:hypothetical protein
VTHSSFSESLRGCLHHYLSMTRGHSSHSITMVEQILPSNKNARLIFYGLAALGFFNTWGRSALDGTLRRLFVALHGEQPFLLPGTKYALKTKITGIRYPIDYLLDVLILFFWQAVDGSHPSTSVIGIYFLTQYFSTLTGFYIDSFRSGNARKGALR